MWDIDNVNVIVRDNYGGRLGLGQKDLLGMFHRHRFAVHMNIKRDERLVVQSVFQIDRAHIH